MLFFPLGNWPECMHFPLHIMTHWGGSTFSGIDVPWRLCWSHGTSLLCKQMGEWVLRWEFWGNTVLLNTGLSMVMIIQQRKSYVLVKKKQLKAMIKTTVDKSLREKKELLHYWWEFQLAHFFGPMVDNIFKVKINDRNALWPSNLSYRNVF